MHGSRVFHGKEEICPFKLKREVTHEPNSPTIVTVTGVAVLSVAHAGSYAAIALVRLDPLFANLPKSVLGATIIQTVVFGLMDIKAMNGSPVSTAPNSGLGVNRIAECAVLRHAAGGDHDEEPVLSEKKWPTPRYLVAYRFDRGDNRKCSAGGPDHTARLGPSLAKNAGTGNLAHHNVNQ
jgi:hypothetical protein